MPKDGTSPIAGPGLTRRQALPGLAAAGTALAVRPGSTSAQGTASARIVIAGAGAAGLTAGDVPLVVELQAGGFARLNVMRPSMLGQPCFL